MAHWVVKITKDDNGEEITDAKWCLSVNRAGSDMAFCSGQFYGSGESGCEYKEKEVQRGGITCQQCLKQIREIKSVNL